MPPTRPAWAAISTATGSSAGTPTREVLPPTLALRPTRVRHLPTHLRTRGSMPSFADSATVLASSYSSTGTATASISSAPTATARPCTPLSLASGPRLPVCSVRLSGTAQILAPLSRLDPAVLFSTLPLVLLPTMRTALAVLNSLTPLSSGTLVTLASFCLRSRFVLPLRSSGLASGSCCPSLTKHSLTELARWCR